MDSWESKLSVCQTEMISVTTRTPLLSIKASAASGEWIKLAITMGNWPSGSFMLNSCH